VSGFERPNDPAPPPPQRLDRRLGRTRWTFSGGATTLGVLGFAMLLLVPVAGASPSVSRPGASAMARPLANDTININALSNLGYDPNTFTVHPGDLVHLTVTQEANFAHTFVLSRLANFTFDPAASASNLTMFFRANAPLVNLTLDSTPGSKAFANFTAPAAGSYEFVCIQPQHFQSGMHGEMISTTSTSMASASLPTTEIVGIGAAIGILVVVVIVLMARRRKGPSPPTGGPG
jgi:uncharacterized cupredoxin-like copper-binding protein